MHKVCPRKAARDPAPARERGRCAGCSRRPPLPGAKPGFAAAESGGGGKGRRDGKGRKGSQALPGAQRCPRPQPGLAPGKGKGGDFLAGHGIRGLRAFSSPTRVPFPPPPGCLRTPQPGSPGREESVGVCAQAHPLALVRGWHGSGEPGASPAPCPRAGQRVPGQGWAGDADAQGARRRGRRRAGCPRQSPASHDPSSVLGEQDRVPHTHTHPPTRRPPPPPPAPVPFPRRGTHLQRPDGPGGQQEQRQAGQHRDPAWGSECAGCEWEIRRALPGSASLSPPRSPGAPALARLLGSGCSRLPPLKKLTEQERGGGGGGARSRESQLIPPTRLATRQRPLAEPRGAAPARAPPEATPASSPQVRWPGHRHAAAEPAPPPPWAPGTKEGMTRVRDRDRQSGAGRGAGSGGES